VTRLLGPIVTPMSVRQGVKRLLTPANVGVYADEIVRQEHPAGTDLTHLRILRVQDVALREEFRLPEIQLPALLIRCPNFEPTYRDGSGSYTVRARLSIAVMLLSSDHDGEDGQYVASVLGMACAALIVQNLEGFDDRIDDVDWLGVDNLEVVDQRSRAMHGVNHGFELTIGDVLTDLGGPLPQITDPPIGDDAANPGDLPPVETTGNTTTPVEEIDP